MLQHSRGNAGKSKDLTLKLSYFDSLWICYTTCCTTNPQEIEVVEFVLLTTLNKISVSYVLSEYATNKQGWFQPQKYAYLFPWMNGRLSIILGYSWSNKCPWWLHSVQQLVLRLDYRAHIKPTLQRLHWLPVKAGIQFKIATVMHATLLINVGQHISAISSNSTGRNLDVAISVPLQPTQLLSWGHGPSSGSAPSPSAVQVSGTRFLLTSGIFFLLRLFAKR